MAADGSKHDGEKDRWDLLPDEPIHAIVRVLTYGARKYAPDNWKKVPEWRRRYYAAMKRHLHAWRGGERCDGESGLPHLAHAACCLIFLMWLDERSPQQKSEPEHLDPGAFY